MAVSRIYHGWSMVYRVYHKGEIIFLRDQIIFHAIEDGKLVVYGALVANSSPDGLYLDCYPAWTYPVQNDNALIIKQVYSATQNDNVLEVG